MQRNSPVRGRTAAFLVATLTALSVGFGVPDTASAADSLTDVRRIVLEATNAARAQNGLAPLRENTALHDIAQDCSQSQAAASKMAHCAGYHTRYPAGWRSAAENVAYGQAPRDVVTAWMNSEGHRANILNPQHTDIGIGYALDSRGRPYYTQNFAGYPGAAPTRFVDVPRGAPFFAEIEWTASTGISEGWRVAGGREYRPFATVTRDAMAAFLYRAAGSPAYTAPAQSPFSDVPTTAPFYREIAWLNARGISTGWADGDRRVFRPYDAITRDAMAAFLYRLAGSPDVPAPTRSPFVDVPLSSPFATPILWLDREDISNGWTGSSGREYRPFAPITRDAMAAFLYRYKN